MTVGNINWATFFCKFGSATRKPDDVITQGLQANYSQVLSRGMDAYQLLQLLGLLSMTHKIGQRSGAILVRPESSRSIFENDLARRSRNSLWQSCWAIRFPTKALPEEAARLWLYTGLTLVVRRHIPSPSTADSLPLVVHEWGSG